MATQSNEKTEVNDATNTSAPSTVPQWLKAELFENVLKETVPGYKQIKSFKAVPGTSAGENYATIMLRISFEVELKDGTDKIISFMMKLPHDSDLYREMMKKNNLFVSEFEMYSKFVPELEQLYRDVGVDIKFGAKCYKIDAPSDYVLLEDLSQKGFKNANRLDGLNVAHVQNSLRLLAQWHAASAVRVATKGDYPEYCRLGFFTEENRPMIEEMNKGLFKHFYACMLTYDSHEIYEEQLVSLQGNLWNTIYRSAQIDPNEFNALNHGDFWCNNIMFQYDEFGEIKQTYAVDYQIPKYGSVATDLLYFLISSTKLEDKISRFDHNIKYYHDNLIEHLKLLNYTKPLPKLKDLHMSLFNHGIWGYCTATGVMGAVLLDPTDIASFDNFLSESADGADFKRLMYSNARYRRHIVEVLPWLYNRGALEADPL